MTELQATELFNLLFYVGCILVFGLGALFGAHR